MGIDHSNPYIHSTTVVCDITLQISLLVRSRKEGEKNNPDKQDTYDTDQT